MWGVGGEFLYAHCASGEFLKANYCLSPFFIKGLFFGHGATKLRERERESAVCLDCVSIVHHVEGTL